MPEDEEQVAASPDYCRHCGEPKNVVTLKNAVTLTDTPYDTGDDWLCASCEHWQDSMLCPTCKQPARISLMPADLAPKAAKPKKA